jgi:flavin reductase (DIM6/NTAB) family NADH-FMN oxidoreductase RutF
MNDLWYKITAEKKINLYLKGNLYDQVRIAYSVPRTIYLVSLGMEGLFNIFPTDLSGKAGEDHFVVSLRTDRRANEQLEIIGKCLIATMHSDSFMEVYQCGRNHTKDLMKADSLGISLKMERSEKLNLPVPENALNYYELERLSKVEIGVHSIHFFKIISSVQLQRSDSALAHIHRYCAEWRQNKNIKTSYLLRS